LEPKAKLKLALPQLRHHFSMLQCSHRPRVHAREFSLGPSTRCARLPLQSLLSLTARQIWYCSGVRSASHQEYSRPSDRSSNRRLPKSPMESSLLRNHSLRLFVDNISSRPRNRGHDHSLLDMPNRGSMASRNPIPCRTCMRCGSASMIMPARFQRKGGSVLC
jgi:hypothetical protein